MARHLAHRGHHVVVVTVRVGSLPYFEKTEDGFVVYRLRGVRFPLPALANGFKWLYITFPFHFFTINRIINLHRINMIHQQGQVFDLFYTCAILAWLKHIPSVFTFQTYMQSPNKLINGLFRIFEKTITRPLMRTCSFYFIAGEVKKTLPYFKERYGIGPSRIIINYGVEFSRPDAAKCRAIRQQHGKFLLHVGHISQLRPGITLVKTFAEVLRSNDGLTLLVIGEHHTDSMQALVKKLGLQRKVTFLGPLPKKETIHYQKAAFAFTQDLDLGFGIGTATLESMYYGVPCLTAIDEDLYPPMMFRDGHNILFVKRGDYRTAARKILRLLSDRKFYRKLSRNAPQVIRRHFDWDRNVRSLENYYCRTIEEQSTPHMTPPETTVTPHVPSSL